MSYAFKPAPGNVQTILSISTGNIPEHTAQALNNRDSPLFMDVCVDPYEYGFIIWAGTYDMADSLVYHPELRDLIEFATQQGHVALRLDCDCLPLSGAPTFNW